MNKAGICLVTSQHLSYNPRLLKEADALHEAGYLVRVVAMRLERSKAEWDARLMTNRGWKLETVNVGRDNFSGRFNWLKGALRQKLYQRFTWLRRGLNGAEMAFSRHWPELARLAAREPADLFIAHNLQALPAAANAAQRWNGKLGFDAEDFHRGETGGNLDDNVSLRQRIEAVEQKYIPHCDHLTAASDGIGDAYAKVLGVRKPVTVLNVFPLAERNGHTPPEALRRERGGEGLSLYWYSQVIGAGRGLEDALLALAQLGSGARLHLRGTWAQGYEAVFRARCRELGIEDRVHVLPIAPPEQLVERATQHDVGLALELGETENRRICVTNKILNYYVAGLAIAAADVPGQRAIMEKFPGAGFLFRAGDAATLAAQVMEWMNNPESLRQAKARAKVWAESSLCWDREKEKLVEAVANALSPTAKTPPLETGEICG